jgi:hypothetical protein
MAKRYDASPVQLCLALDAPVPTAALYKPLKAIREDCASPIRFGQDEYRCRLCGLIWGVDEPRPACFDRNGNTSFNKG